MWHTFGHNSAKQLLDQQLASRGFSHAYLFCGPPDIGKKSLAREFASRILSVPAPDSHPDFIAYDLNSAGSIEAIRELLSRLAVKPFAGERKVAVIDNFNEASPAVANALLKTLEEPSPSTIIILISATRNLMPTIISRCQVVNFNRFSAQAMEEYNQKAQVGADASLLALSGGAPGRLEMLMKDPDSARELILRIERLEKLPGSPVSDRLLAVGQLAELETDELKNLFAYWLNQKRLNLSVNPSGFPLIQRLLESLDLFSTNINKKLILQRLLLNI